MERPPKLPPNAIPSEAYPGSFYYRERKGEWTLYDPSEISDKPLDIPEARKATVPLLAFEGKAERYKGIMDVYTGRISRELLAAGFPESIAYGYAIVLHDQAELRRKDRKKYQLTHGWYHQVYALRRQDHITTYPLAIHAVIVRDPKVMAKIIMHEFGHAHQDLVAKTIKPPIYTPKNIRRAERAGKAAIAAGLIVEAGSLALLGKNKINYPTLAVGTAVAEGMIAAGKRLSEQPLYTLWQMDRSERYARKFERQHQMDIVTYTK